jgi:hypothetical protein
VVLQLLLECAQRDDLDFLLRSKLIVDETSMLENQFRADVRLMDQFLCPLLVPDCGRSFSFRGLGLLHV